MEFTISEIKSRTKVVLNKTSLSLRAIFKNKAIMVLLILFPFLSIIPASIFMPFYAGAGFLVQLNVILTTGLIYGTIVFGFKHSTLNKNEKLLTKSRSVSYLSALFVIACLVFISSGIQLIFMIIFNKLNFLMSNWAFTSSEGRGYDLSYLRYGAWIWSIFWTMMITFAIFFATRRFISSEKSHYFVVCGILVVSLIWGGSLNDYWAATVYVESIGTNDSKIIPTLFPRNLYWPTVIVFPFYAPGQIASRAADFTITTNGEQWGEYSRLSFDQPLIHLSWAKDYEFRAEWNALILAPIIWTAFLTSMGIILKTK